MAGAQRTTQPECADSAVRPSTAVRSAAARVRKVAIPTTVLRRWDAQAALQLCEHLALLAQENDELRRRLSDAEDRAAHWYQNTIALAGDDASINAEGVILQVLS